MVIMVVLFQIPLLGIVFSLLLNLARDKHYVKEDSSLLVHWSLAAPLTALSVHQIYVRCVVSLIDLVLIIKINKIVDL